jgi:hypothetical protein
MTIVIQGGLLRAEPLWLEGICFVLAHEVGHLLGGDPKDKKGYTCDGEADYYGLSASLRDVWFDDLYATIVFPGLTQVKALFKFLTDSTDSQYGPCKRPTLDCRVSTYEAALALNPLPACAGGPEPSPLTVQSASASDKQSVSIVFNEAVDPTTAQNTSNYKFDPEATVEEATVDASNPAVVTIKTTLAKDAYWVTVSNVLAQNGAGLEPDKNRAHFETKPTA